MNELISQSMCLHRKETGELATVVIDIERNIVRCTVCDAEFSMTPVSEDDLNTAIARLKAALSQANTDDGVSEEKNKTLNEAFDNIVNLNKTISFRTVNG